MGMKYLVTKTATWEIETDDGPADAEDLAGYDAPDTIETTVERIGPEDVVDAEGDE